MMGGFQFLPRDSFRFYSQVSLLVGIPTPLLWIFRSDGVSDAEGVASRDNQMRSLILWDAALLNTASRRRRG